MEKEKKEHRIKMMDRVAFNKGIRKANRKADEKIEEARKTPVTYKKGDPYRDPISGAVMHISSDQQAAQMTADDLKKKKK